MKEYNPSLVNSDKKLNYLAGMNNFDNNCYMNSTLQCLIRTPYLDKYLSSMVLVDKKKKNGSVTETLYIVQ